MKAWSEMLKKIFSDNVKSKDVLKDVKFSSNFQARGFYH